MSAVAQPKPVKTSHRLRRIGTLAVVLIVVFLLGVVPLGVKLLASARSLTETQQQLSLISIQNTLASSVIDAQRGNYEPARQTASNFFTLLRTETDKGNDSSFSLAQREGIQPLFEQRDGIITLLARSDPASADRLSNLYVAYRQIVSH